MTLIDLYLTYSWTKTKANVTTYITNTFYKYFGSKHVNAGKNYSSDLETILKIEAEGREFAKLLRSLEQFCQTVKG